MMKIPHIIIVITVVLLLFALVSQGYGMEQKSSINDACTLILKNTDSSNILISTKPPEQKKQLTLNELTQYGALIIAPYQTKEIHVERWVSIYTRVAQTNNMFELHYTLAKRSCKKTQTPLTITMQQIERDQLNPAYLLVIDHLHQDDIPEKVHRLCPKGKLPVWDKQEEQWFCKTHRWSDINRQYEDEYVPVQTYIHRFIPDWIISKWYIQHPTYYNWYHVKPHLWQHLSSYKAPWQSDWYKQWYETASDSEKKYLHKPDATPINYEQKKCKAYGFEQGKMKICPIISAHE